MDSIHPDAEPKNHHDGGTDSLIGEIQPEPSPYTNDKPYDKGHVFHGRIRLAIEITTLFAIVGGVVVACATLLSINKSVVEAVRSAAAAEQAANAATTAAGAADEQLKLSREQMTLTQEQMAAAREQMTLIREQVEADRDALRLEQRAWLGYDRFILEARPRGTNAAWEARELIAGEAIQRGACLSLIPEIRQRPTPRSRVVRDSFVVGRFPKNPSGTLFPWREKERCFFRDMLVRLRRPIP